MYAIPPRALDNQRLATTDFRFSLSYPTIVPRASKTNHSTSDLVTLNSGKSDGMAYVSRPEIWCLYQSYFTFATRNREFRLAYFLKEIEEVCRETATTERVRCSNANGGARFPVEAHMAGTGAVWLPPPKAKLILKREVWIGE